MRNRHIKKAHISEQGFREKLKCFGLDIPAMTTAALVGMRRQTVQRIYSLLRERIVRLALEELNPFAGEIEVDERCFGPRRVRGKRGRGAAGKTPVPGLHKRGAFVFLSAVPDCSRQALMPILKGHIQEQSDVHTDGWKSHDGLILDGYKHHRIHHHENQFVRGKNRANGIEFFWSFAPSS